MFACIAQLPAQARRHRYRMMPSILVVEDEPAIVELLKVNLADAGYEVREATDAEEAACRERSRPTTRTRARGRC